MTDRANWHKPLATFCTAILLGAVSLAYAASSPPPLQASRVALTSVEAQGSKATALFGFWFQGQGKAPEKKPTVIALHGCAGLYSHLNDEKVELTPRYVTMARMLTDAGYNVLFPDSFTPRGKRTICQETATQRNTNSINRRRDVQVALRWIASQNHADNTRVALLGWSNGGTTVLSALDLTQTDVAVRKVQPRAAIAFYPNCATYTKNRKPYKPASPLLILMGENDDRASPQACETLEKRLKNSDTPVILHLYPDTYHDFDAPGMPWHVRMDIPGVGAPGHGVVSAGNQESRAEAYQEILKFLKEKFD